MTLTEYNELNNTNNCNLITANDLSPHFYDRTLLCGHTHSLQMFHVYMKDSKIYAVTYTVGFVTKRENKEYNTYAHAINMTPVEIQSNFDYIPKKLYPERCDYDFCNMLKIRGLNLPFLQWDDKRQQGFTNGAFNGLTLDARKCIIEIQRNKGN